MAALVASLPRTRRNRPSSRKDGTWILGKQRSWKDKSATAARAVRYGKPAPNDNSVDDVFEWDGSLLNSSLQLAPKSSSSPSGGESWKNKAVTTARAVRYGKPAPHDNSVDDEFEWDGSLMNSSLELVPKSVSSPSDSIASFFSDVSGSMDDEYDGDRALEGPAWRHERTEFSWQSGLATAVSVDGSVDDE